MPNNMQSVVEGGFVVKIAHSLHTMSALIPTIEAAHKQYMPLNTIIMHKNNFQQNCLVCV